MGGLIDTGIWIQFFRGVNEEQIRLVQKLILNNQVCICPPIIQEILQGIGDAETFDKLSKQMMSLHFLEADPKLMAVNAAKIYVDLRKRGVTIRKSMDCLIASYALVFDVPLYYSDRDFDQIANFFPLRPFFER